MYTCMFFGGGGGGIWGNWLPVGVLWEGPNG